MEEFKSQCVIDYLNDPLDHNLRNKAVKELTKVHKFLRKMTSGISGLNRFLLSSCLSLVMLPCLALSLSFPSYDLWHCRTAGRW